MSWKTYAAGIAESALSGAMTAVSTNFVDPHDFNFGTRKFWVCAGASAALSAIKYTWRVLQRITKDDPDINQQPYGEK